MVRSHRSSVAVRHGDFLVHLPSAADAASLVKQLQGDAGKHGPASEALPRLGLRLQQQVSDGLGTHCSTLRDGIFKLKKSVQAAALSDVEVARAAIKKLEQINVAASVLRHYSSAWEEQVVSELASILGQLPAWKSPSLGEPFVPEVFPERCAASGSYAGVDRGENYSATEVGSILSDTACCNSVAEDSSTAEGQPCEFYSIADAIGVSCQTDLDGRGWFSPALGQELRARMDAIEVSYQNLAEISELKLEHVESKLCSRLEVLEEMLSTAWNYPPPLTSSVTESGHSRPSQSSYDLGGVGQIESKVTLGELESHVSQMLKAHEGSEHTWALENCLQIIRTPGIEADFAAQHVASMTTTFSNLAARKRDS
eukprot:TRINITY_DN27298_c0_g2_i1.p1 TRINITY_DN27298_c0_g2~~TRINITY_DN27298_c0_g2_i1.p1  ORF type:complete len:385 (+),score=73.20 TRINITY_DN27298_c0_g2_i1:48-1157(+)